MTALVIVDVQNDFCPGGALAVPEGDTIVPVINRLMTRFPLVVATRDWHPLNHGSFAATHPGLRVGDRTELAGLEQVLWPVHCVQETWGAEFHPALDQGPIARTFLKGSDPEIDSYSAFFDNAHRKSTGLAEYLREQGVERIAVCGLATDYCVKFTAVDALELGFAVDAIVDAMRGVNLVAGDAARALEEMRARGARLLHAAALETGGSAGRMP